MEDKRKVPKSLTLDPQVLAAAQKEAAETDTSISRVISRWAKFGMVAQGRQVQG